MYLNPLYHRFTNVAIMFQMLIALCLIVPLFFVIRFIRTIVKSFYRQDNMMGKVVLITGASSGIGEYMAYEYARRKASLVIVARRESRLCEVAEKARRLGSPDVLLFCADVSNKDACKKFVDEAITHFARYHLVNNAGIASICPFERANEFKNFTHVMDINFWGSIYPTYFAIPHLKRTKGTIIVNSSSAALLHPPNASFYNASKSALISFFETLRVELAPSIKITIITLGFVESEMTQGRHLNEQGNMEVDKRFRDQVIKSIPLMSTEPCAKAIVDGACQGKRYVTEPQFYRVLILLKFFCPELFDWFYRNIHLARLKHMQMTSSSNHESHSLDYTIVE